MAGVERVAVILPAEMAGAVRDAVEEGDYSSAGEVVREALQDWVAKRALRTHAFAAMKAEIGKGMVDLAEERVGDFDPARIAEQGGALSPRR